MVVQLFEAEALCKQMGRVKSSSTASRGSLLLLLIPVVSVLFAAVAAERRRISIPDDLSDVVDEEEDEDWKKWGQKTTRSEDLLPPPDFSKMNHSEIQAEMMKHHTGPAFGFVKLRPGAVRSREDVPVIAMKWSNVIRTGSIEARFMAVDRNTIMFTMERGQDLEEFKEFVLSQPEAYEMKIGEHFFRRDGDPPLDQVIDKLNREKSAGDAKHSSDRETDPSNDEL
ncbi:hypothetical protein AXF42_Ash015247 [Apostasia shenzhenica]|uniref:LDLR chaperone MESD n=1 Tax=Apostasia shenzhenica TaxID=1088818 RepID=A0A2I0ALQ4_9ASPA|nr:hypothetical protein AXF42_Ash015247 [Apostasia shenzhenica]